MEQAAEEAADRAVSKVFAILGVDIDNPSQVEQFRESLRFADRFRKITERSAATMITTVVGLIVTGIVYACWEGLTHYLGRGQ